MSGADDLDLEEPRDNSNENERLEALLIEASVARGRGDFRKALALLEAAEALDPADPRIWDLRGDLHADQAHFETAIECYAKALEIDPAREETEEKLGLASLGRLRTARLRARAQKGGDDAQNLKRRAQMAMVASLLFPGLGHLVLERTVRSIAFGGTAAVLLILWVTLRNAADVDPTNIGALWTSHLALALVLADWIVAFIDAARCATLRDDEELY